MASLRFARYLVPQNVFALERKAETKNQCEIPEPNPTSMGNTVTPSQQNQRKLNRYICPYKHDTLYVQQTLIDLDIAC